MVFPSEGDVSLVEGHDSGFDLVPEPLTNYRHQVEFVSLRNFVAMILRSTGLPTPLLDSSSSTAPTQIVIQWDAAILHPPLVKVLKDDRPGFFRTRSSQTMMRGGTRKRKHGGGYGRTGGTYFYFAAVVSVSYFPPPS